MWFYSYYTVVYLIKFLYLETRKNKLSGVKRKHSLDSEDIQPKLSKNLSELHAQNPKVFTEEALSNLKIYNELKTEYEDEGVNQQTHQFLNRISQRKILENPNLNTVPLMQLLSTAWKTMMLSEFEIATWGAWLDTFDLDTFDLDTDKDFNCDDYIMFSAFYIKMILNDEAYLNNMFQSYFNCYVKGFIVKFNEWLKKNYNKFQFNPIIVNKKFKELNKPFNPKKEQYAIDYNHWVDDILQISPPYNYWSEKDHKSKGKPFEGGMNTSQNFDSKLLDSSQISIVPTKKKIFTIPADASQHQIQWDPYLMNEDEIDNIGMKTRLSKKKSSIFSIKDIVDNMKPLDDGGLFKKTSNNGRQINMSQLNDFYNLDAGLQDVNLDLNLDNRYSSQINRSGIIKSKPQRVSVGFTGKSSGNFSNISNSNDYGRSQIQDGSNNLFKHLNNSLGLVRIPTNWFNGLEFDDKDMMNIPDIPNISSRGNSFQQLLKNDPTPALFRGGSSIIDPRMFMKKN
jgi:hypothetical protein